MARTARYEGFTFESMRYAVLTGDGKEEAIVDLEYHSGGSQTTDYIYVYTLDHHRPKLLPPRSLLPEFQGLNLDSDS